MPKCLRCGAGGEWFEGEPKEILLGPLKFVVHENAEMPKDEIVLWHGGRSYLFKIVDELTGDSTNG